MYKSLLFSRLPLRRKVKSLFAYMRIRRGAKLAWSRRFKKVFENNPHLNGNPPRDLIGSHLSVWRQFRNKVNLCDLKISSNGNETCDPRIVPEEIFISDIEPTLNGITDLSLLANKSLYYKLYDPSLFPVPFLHVIEGRPYDADLIAMRSEALDAYIDTLPYPVLSKPNKGTAGGVGVAVSSTPDELRRQLGLHADLVVQELIHQDQFFQKFNSRGLNTIRVNLYRSVKDDKVRFLNCALRMGVGGSLDNLTGGGIVCHINDEGFLSGVARNKYGAPFKRHPDTQLAFIDKIPKYEELKAVALAVGEQVAYGRLFSLDMCLDQQGNWRLIEINMHGQTIRFAQYAGVPFFGSFTEEVVEFCRKNHWAVFSS